MPHGSRTQPDPPQKVCAADRQAEHLSFARAERANLDAALAWSVTHDPLLR